MSKCVQILNPLANGSQYTNLRRANSFVKSGRAKWEGSALRFIGDAGRLHLQLSIEHRVRTQDEAGYDGIGLIRYDQIAGVPVINVSKLISPGGRLIPKHDSCRTISKISLD